MDEKYKYSDFFDKYIKPEDLTIEKLNEINNDSYISILHNIKIIDDIFENFIENKFEKDKYNEKDYWSDSISEVFFKKYGLDNYNLIPSLDDNNKQKLRKNIPYPIINGSIFINDNTDIGQIEFTPLYYGIPSIIKYNDKIIGNNYCDPLGFCAVNDKNINDIITQSNNTIIKIKEINNKISINKQSSISSNAISVPLQYHTSNKIYDLLDFSFFNYFDYNSNYFNNNMRVTDGALYDNIGLLSLLRRKVNKIILTNPSSFNVNNLSTDIKKSMIGDIAGYFGIGSFENTYYGQSQEDYNRYRKVFKEDKWIEFTRLLKDKIDKKESIVFEMVLEVLENKYNGVNGNYNVTILFILLDKCNWIDKLPLDSKNLINKTSNNIIEEFLETARYQNKNLKDFYFDEGSYAG